MSIVARVAAVIAACAVWLGLAALVGLDHAEGAERGIVRPTGDYYENTPGCISHREWVHFTRDTMHNTEARTGVLGLGKLIVWQNGGDHMVVAYPWCGHPARDQIQVSYDRNRLGQFMCNYVTEFDVA